MPVKKEKKDDMFYIRTTKSFKEIFKKRLLENNYKGFTEFFKECIRKFMNRTKKNEINRK